MNNPLKIVVLDGYTLNPGDLSWEELEKLGDLTVYDRTSVDEIIANAKEADIVFTNKVSIDAVTLANLPRLKFIGVLATGYNIVDIVAARQNGIIVANVPGYSTASVAQLAFAMLLELTHHVQRHSDSVMAGVWADSADFSYWNYPLIELADKTIGIVGFGSIGEKMADIATAFGMQVIGSKRHHTDQSHRPNFRWANLPDLLAQSDVVSLHTPLTTDTHGFINKKTLALMKPSAFLLNTSRGPLIVEQDLADALNKGIIAGAGIDVLSQEPPAADNSLFKIKNCLITPHIAWATKEARTRLMATTVSNLTAFINGKPVNVVN